MTIAAAALLASTWSYAGFQWTIRVLVYPQFAAVPAAVFPAYEQRHLRRTTVAVGPLFVFAGASAIAAFAARPNVWSALAGACVAAILAVTALAAVPAHRRLSSGFDDASYRRLMTVDSGRLALALGAAGAAVGFALTG